VIFKDGIAKGIGIIEAVLFNRTTWHYQNLEYGGWKLA